jgi:hypothetical protein
MCVSDPLARYARVSPSRGNGIRLRKMSRSFKHFSLYETVRGSQRLFVLVEPFSSPYWDAIWFRVAWIDG